MTFVVNNTSRESHLNQSQAPLPQAKSSLFSQSAHPYQHKYFSYLQLIEICLLVLITCEHTIIFILTFKRKPILTNRTKQNQHAILLPTKSFLYSCLHRNWIRAFSFSNICLSIVYFVMLLLKHFHPNLVHYSSITYYSMPLNLLQQILIDFSTFHLFIISISVFQYFLRYYRLLKNTYSSCFFNGKSLLLTKHTNVALILSSSLALIFAYNYVFYAPKQAHTVILLPLITINMTLLPLINVIILLFVLLCLMINYIYKSSIEDLPNGSEQDSLRLMIEKNTCIKCYSKILEKNPNLFQDKNYSYRNLYKIFFPTRLKSSFSARTRTRCPYDMRNIYAHAHVSYDDGNDSESNSRNNLFFKTTLMKLNRQHSLCHLCYCLLLVFLMKYVLLTFPQHILLMLFYLIQFYHFIIKKNVSVNLTYSLYANNEFLITICHYLFLLSRFGDSLLLLRLPYLIKKYFPCWCHCNSNMLRKQQPLSSSLARKSSQSSCGEPTAHLNATNVNDSPGESPLDRSALKSSRPNVKQNRRFRLQFQFVPLWSNDRPKLFQEHA